MTAAEREAGFCLGSNLGDRRAALVAARDALAALPGVRRLAASPIYETEPVGVKPEFRHLAYLNAVVILSAPRDAAGWMADVHRIEADLGRVRTSDRFAPRTVDIDLLYCGTEWTETENLTVPHPRWSERRFVVRPLADVRPDLRLPGCDRTVREVLAGLPADAGRVRLFAAEW